jgi:hypothetical protein
MRKIFLFLMLILLAMAVSAQDDWFLNSKNVIIDIKVSSEAGIEPTSSEFNVKYINVNLSHFPYEDYNQEVQKFDFEPLAKIEDNALLFEWDNPKDKIAFGYSARIKTSNDIIKIREKVKFPLVDLPEGLEKFTVPSQIIDSDSAEIIELASKLVEGEDDLYAVVHKLAEWTKGNVNYNLSTLTADVSQKASWVLEKRQGVCDELTSLFIAMLRSVGVPAKFISGVAYTNSPLFPENWGSHGWAEVYFPGFGWVPYDVTYGQFGYVDPTHVKLKESIDSNEPSVRYKWLARNVNLETKKLAINALEIERIGRVDELITVDIRPFKDSVDFGSHNLIEVVLENMENYYISSEIFLSLPKEVDVIGTQFRNVLLKPNEKKSIFFIVRLTKGLKENFIYTFPLAISTGRNLTKSSSFASQKGEIFFSYNGINNILKQKMEEEEKVYSKDVSLKCYIEKNEFYSYEKSIFECRVGNTGNVFLENLNLCYKDNCENFNLGITQIKKFNFTFESLEEGKQEAIVSLKNEDVGKAEYVDINVLDEPLIKIDDIEYPNYVNYRDNFKISFILSKESNSIPRNVEIRMSQNGFEKTFLVEELSEDRKMVVNLLGKGLRKGKNEFKIAIKYEDGKNRTFKEEGSFIVELANVTLFQNFLLTGNFFIRGIEKLSFQNLLLILISTLFVFTFVVWFVMRNKR